MKYSILEDTDSYKASHWLQYPPGTTGMFSYIESRGGEYPETVFFGLQYYLKEYLVKPVTVKQVEKMVKFCKLHGVPFNYEGWMYIAKELKGKLPIRIRAVPEGSVVPTHNILVSVESTDPKAFWAVSWIETSIMRAAWYGVNVATRSYTIKKIIKAALEKSSDDPAGELPFKLHNFGSRGVSSQESAMVGDMAHLVNFQGTDTTVGVMAAADYYNCPMAGFSIPASEHSSITSWGKENEADAYRNMLKQFAKPGAIVACVSDSYDLWNAITNLWGGVLKEEVINSGAALVVRPDSGDPSSVVLKSLQLLDEKFGHTINSKGYKVLNHVRVIQGDGINEHSIKKILDNVLSHEYSATNINFGMGGALMQQHDRDTNKFAMKCSSITVNGENRDVFKSPITDNGKRSKAGRLDLVATATPDGVLQYSTVVLSPERNSHDLSIMQTVYENGELLVDDDLETIRKRSNQNTNK